jgi:hypothetical protein
LNTLWAGLNTHYDIEKYLTVFLPTSNTIKGGTVKGFDQPLGTMLETDCHCFRAVWLRLLRADNELFPALASYFIEDHFDQYANNRARTEVQRILKSLQDNLAARFNVQSKIEPGEYRTNYLNNINQSIADIYETLKHYGINATNYPEARDQAEKLYKDPEPSQSPRDTQSTINERINEIRNKARAHVLTLASLFELKKAVPKEYPGQEREIEWEIDKIINDFRRGKL